MKTVGEGVESRQDWHVLRQAGCDFAQGYFIAKPMPGENIVDWLREWAERREEVTAEAAKPLRPTQSSRHD
jgi:EAL domain-containing protein (putative c-di-GMP-specific phosphodiesterase class I)